MSRFMRGERVAISYNIPDDRLAGMFGTVVRDQLATDDGMVRVQVVIDAFISADHLARLGDEA